MSDRSGLWAREPLLRIVGAAAVVAGLYVMRWLFRSGAGVAPIAPSAVQLLAAAIGFLGLSMGSALLVLGTHLLDDVALSDRWIRRTPSARMASHVPVPLDAAAIHAPSGLAIMPASGAA